MPAFLRWKGASDVRKGNEQKERRGGGGVGEGGGGGGGGGAEERVLGQKRVVDGGVDGTRREIGWPPPKRLPLRSVRRSRGNRFANKLTPPLPLPRHTRLAPNPLGSEEDAAEFSFLRRNAAAATPPPRPSRPALAFVSWPRFAGRLWRACPSDLSRKSRD